VFVELLEYLIHNGAMSGYVFVFGFFQSSGGVNCHIVHVDRHAPIGDEVSEDSVHHCLECGQQISESKEHDRRFV